MARIPSSEETAREVLAIAASDMKVRPNESVMLRPLQTIWQSAGRHSADLATGIQYAVERGWLRFDTEKNAHFLTAAGFAAADDRVLANASPNASRAPVINIHGSVGAVQTGDYAVANVAQSHHDPAQLIEALIRLREKIEQSSEITSEQREQQTELIGDVVTAITSPKPNKPKVKALLGALGTGIRTVASLGGAWHVVHAAAVHLGILEP